MSNRRILFHNLLRFSSKVLLYIYNDKYLRLCFNKTYGENSLTLVQCRTSSSQLKRINVRIVLNNDPRAPCYTTKEPSFYALHNFTASGFGRNIGNIV